MASTQLEGLPLTLGLEAAGKMLGISRTTTYELVQRNEFPVRLLRLGRRYRVSRADLLAYLGEVQQPTAGASA